LISNIPSDNYYVSNDDEIRAYQINTLCAKMDLVVTAFKRRYLSRDAYLSSGDLVTYFENARLV